MLAARLPSILPPLAPRELLEISMIQSVAGLLADGALSSRRPFRAPHHSASMAALVGGGINARPGEISLAHHGVLFLDELPEFQPGVLDALRQPLETGEVMIARANHRTTYPARFQLVAAMNPCRCGHATEPGYACRRQPNDRCMAQYQARISGPLLDRIDLAIEVPAVTAADLILPPPAEGSAEVAARVAPRPRDRGAALCGARASTAVDHQRRLPGLASRGGRAARRGRPAPPPRRRRRHAPLGPRLPPHPARSPAPSPISTASPRSAASTWPRPSPTARISTAGRRGVKRRANRGNHG